MERKDKKKATKAPNAADKAQPQAKIKVEQPAPATAQDLDKARESLAKLPILGPVVWLYARAPEKKFFFLADTDWLLLPPIVLDQCRLFMKAGIPHAFFTWAFVSDAVDKRLRSGVPRVAPHEWKSGEHLWLIDVVAPFAPPTAMLDELRGTVFAGRTVNVLAPDPKTGQVAVKELPPLTALPQPAQPVPH